MLLYYVLMLLAIAFPIHGGIIHNYDDEIGKNWFNKEAEIYFRKRCWNNRRQLRYVLRELRNFNSCFEKLFPSLTEQNEDEAQENCFEKRPEVLECIKDTVDLLEPCLPPEENYLPDFILQSYEGFSEFLCQNADLITMKGLMKTNMLTCIERFMRSQMYHPHYLCYELGKFGNRSYEAPILKEELCEDLDSFYDCFERQYKQHCPDAPKAWEYQAGLLNGLRSPCFKIDEEDDQEKEWEGSEEKEEWDGDESEEKEEGEEESTEENLEEEEDPEEDNPEEETTEEGDPEGDPEEENPEEGNPEYENHEEDPEEEEEQKLGEENYDW